MNIHSIYFLFIGLLLVNTKQPIPTDIGKLRESTSLVCGMNMLCPTSLYSGGRPVASFPYISVYNSDLGQSLMSNVLSPSSINGNIS